MGQANVLKAMQLSEEIIKGTVRISWCHMTKTPYWDKVVKTIESFI